MSTKFEDILNPRGKSAALPNVMPSVLDSDGKEVSYFSGKRKTTEATVVDIGDSPNSNTGDALRTAFIKINNHMEAVYWWSEHLNQTLQDLPGGVDSDSFDRGSF